MSNYILNDLIVACKMKSEEIKDKIDKGFTDVKSGNEKYILAKNALYNGEIKKAEKELEEILEETKANDELLADIYVDLGLIKQKNDDVIKAFKYYCKGLEIAMYNNDEFLISKCFINIGEILIYLKYKDEALYIYNQINLNDLVEDKVYYILALANLAYLNYYMDNTELGNYYSKLFFDATSINKRKDKWVEILKNYILSERYACVLQYDKSLSYLKKNEDSIVNKIDYLSYQIDYSKIYKKMGQDKKAKDILLSVIKEEEEYNTVKIEALETLILFGEAECIDSNILLNLLMTNKNSEKSRNNKLLTLNIVSIKEKIELYKKKIREDAKNKSLEILKNRLEDMNVKDSLTESFNRRYLDNFINNTYVLTKEKCTFLMIDIDNFKLVNDILGHLFGDETLLQYAEVFKEIIGDYGKVFRYGGDEFFIIYEHDNLKEASLTLRKISDSIKSLGIYNDIRKCGLTLSIGAITVTPKEKKIFNLKIILSDCDKLMYEGKENGKNQVIHNILS